MTTTHVMPPRTDFLRAPPPAPVTRTPAQVWPLGWAALLLPGLVRLGVAVASGAAVDAAQRFTWLAPGALVAAWVAWLHRPRARREVTRLKKELRPLAPVAAAMSAVGVGAALGAGALVELLLAVGLSALAVVAFAEGETGTLEAWLTQPLPRWRLFAEKGVLVLTLATAFVAQVLAVAPALELSQGYGPCLAAALGLAPVLALTLRGTVNALAVSTLFSLGALLVFGEPGALGEALPAGVAVFASAALLAVPWAAVLLRRGSHAGLPDFGHQRWGWTAGRTPVASLVRKEARLQLPVFGVLVPGLVLWLDAALQHRPDIATALAGFFGVLGALLAGAIPVTSEHEYGTWSAEAAQVPARTAWRVKAGVSFAVAVLVGVGVTWLLVAATPGLLPVRQEVAVGGSWVDPDGQSLRRLLTTLVVWLGLTATAWSSGLLASTLTRRMTTSFLAALGLLGATVAGVGASLTPGLMISWAWLSPRYDFARFGHALAPPVVPAPLGAAVHALGAVVFVALLPLAYFRAASAARTTGRLPAKAWAALAAAVALAGFCGGLAVS